jgi:hypothetical protein
MTRVFILQCVSGGNQVETGPTRIVMLDPLTNGFKRGPQRVQRGAEMSEWAMKIPATKPTTHQITRKLIIDDA